MAKRYKLKKKVKRKLKLLLILIIVVVGIYGISIYRYHQTNEYKLLKIGYTSNETKKIENKLTQKQIDSLLTEEKTNDTIIKLINQKYFLSKYLEKYIEYMDENREDDYKKTVSIVNAGGWRDPYKLTEKADISKGKAVLVNKYNLLTEDYNPGTIKTFSSEYAYGTVSAEEECYNAFIEMADAAKEDGITLLATSGYRTYEHQDEVYQEMRNYQGKIYADAYAARAGASEHETGLALDVFTYSATTDNFEKTDTYKWLIKNSYKYGFIRRYDDGKKDITGYSPESWHYRYLGKDLAKKVYNEGITYDEYYAFYLDK